MVKNTGCSFRGPGFDSQHPHTQLLITIYNSTFMESCALFWTLWADTQLVYRHTCRQNIHTHEKKKVKGVFSNRGWLRMFWQLLPGNQISHCLIRVYSLITFTSLAVNVLRCILHSANIIHSIKSTEKPDHHTVLTNMKPPNQEKPVE